MNDEYPYYRAIGNNLFATGHPGRIQVDKKRGASYYFVAIVRTLAEAKGMVQ